MLQKGVKGGRRIAEQLNANGTKPDFLSNVTLKSGLFQSSAVGLWTGSILETQCLHL